MYAMTSMAAQATRKMIPAVAMAASASDVKGRETRVIEPLDRIGVGVEFAKGRTLYCEGDDARPSGPLCDSNGG